VEKLKYGWLWECPMGPQCKYKHALPLGFVFKGKEKKEDGAPEDEKLTLVEQIEAERKQLDVSKGTPVTVETFLKWKEDRKKKKEKEIETKRKEAEKKSGGKGLNVLSGRDLFKYDPSLFVDDADAADESNYEVAEETEEERKEREEREAKLEQDLIRQRRGEEEEEEQTEEGEGQEGKKQEEQEEQEEEEEEGKKEQDKKEAKKEGSKKGETQKKPTKQEEKKKQNDIPVDASLFLDDEQLPDDEPLEPSS